MKRQTFQSFWTGGPLTPYEWMCIKSFLDHGHAYRLYSYNADMKVPEGCQLGDAAEIMPEAAVFTARGGSYAIFADIFRYKLLLERGGWWVDTDIVCLSEDWPDAPRQIGYEPKRAGEPEDFVNNAVLHALTGDPLVRLAYDAARDAHAGTVWGTTGPRLWTQLLADNPQHGYTIHPIERFYSISYHPYHYFHYPDLLTLEGLRARGAVGLHLWNDKFGQYGISKQVAPPTKSILWQCFAMTGTLHLFTEQYLFNANNGHIVGPFAIADITEADIATMLKIAADAMAKGATV